MGEERKHKPWENISVEAFAELFGYDRAKALDELRRFLVATDRGSNWLSIRDAAADTSKLWFGISPKDIEEYREFLSNDNGVDVQKQNKSGTLYLLKRHPAFSTELEAAVSCWLALFADASPGQVAIHTKNKALSWLEQNCPKLTKSQRERLATVLTPDKRKEGGAPPTP